MAATPTPLGWADRHIETTSRCPFSTSNPVDRAFFTTPFGLRNLLEERKFTWRMCRGVDQRYYRSFSWKFIVKL